MGGLSGPPSGESGSPPAGDGAGSGRRSRLRAGSGNPRVTEEEEEERRAAAMEEEPQQKLCHSGESIRDAAQKTALSSA